MRVIVARNDWEGPEGVTFNTVNRRNPLPIVDAHCHVFGQSLVEQLEMHEWANSKMVTFVKAGTNGAVRKTVKPTAFIVKPIPENIKKAAQNANTAAGEAKTLAGEAESMADDAANTKYGGKLKGKLEGEFKKHTGGIKDDVMGKVPGGMPSKEELESAMSAAETASAAVATRVMRKVNARGVVEVPAKEWPPRVTTTQIGDRIFPLYELTDQATILCAGVGAPNTWVGDMRWLFTQMDLAAAKFVKYAFGDDASNARTVIDGTPKSGGRAVVPLLLDMGYTPLSIPMPFLGHYLGLLVARQVDLPDPVPDPDDYYTPGKSMIWFDRDGFEYSYEMLSKVAIENAYEMWPMIPFDPRRPDALSHVKRGIDELGFVGIKLYTRCGWMPYENETIHGPERGKRLDQRLDKLYEYAVDNDLPLLNHTSPGGFPPNAVLRLPRRYDTCAKLYHNRLLFPDRIGVGPIPANIESALRKIADFAADEAGLPRPDDLKKQAKEIQSSLLNDVADMSKQAEKLTGKQYDELLAAFETANSQGERGVQELIELSDGGGLSDPVTRQRLAKFVAPEKLDEIAEHVNPQDFFTLAGNMKEADFAKMSEIMDPRNNTEQTQGALSEFGKRDEDAEKKEATELLFELACDALARKSCYEAAKFCHYIQYTVSPYSWEPVLEKHPKLRINLAHFGSKLSIAAHFGLDKLYEEKLEAEASEGEDNDDSDDSSAASAAASMLNGQAGGGDDNEEDDNDPTNEELLELVAESTLNNLLDHPMVVSGERFKESMFKLCAQRHGALSTLMRQLGTGEDALESEEESDGLLDKVLDRLRPLIFSKVLKEYSIKDLYEGIQKTVPEILDEELWKHWLDDWADEFDKGWVDKIIELMEKYDNVYTDISNFSHYPGADGEYQPLLKRLAQVACPALKETEDLEEFTDYDWDADEHILADRLMIGTDWFMTEEGGMDARGFWNEARAVLTSEHPLWERWASENVVNFMNLDERIEKLEKLYAEHDVPEDKQPKWWAALKAHYKKAAAAS